MRSESPPLPVTDTPTGQCAASQLDALSQPVLEPQTPVVKPALIGCMFRDCGLRVDELPAEAYAAFLEEL